jgi:hypothetical protein
VSSVLECAAGHKGDFVSTAFQAVSEALLFQGIKQLGDEANRLYSSTVLDKNAWNCTCALPCKDGLADQLSVGRNMTLTIHVVVLN